MNLSKLACRLAPVAAAIAVVTTLDRSASACGGCFHPPSQTVSDITDEKMLLSVSPTQSTLYDEIVYSGSPSSFAWVLPIHGTVTVGLSADVVFSSIDTLTATQINPPPSSCPAPNCSGGGGCGSGEQSNALSATDNGGAGGGVQVLTQSTVGPYDTVQLHSTNAGALDAWLTQNGFDIPAAVQPILSAYVSEGFDFLAMKLMPGQGVQAMRPVRVTSQGAGLSLPLRMASVGTGAITGITIWIVADGRYEPQNFPSFYISTSKLVWDWKTSSSNYASLRTAQEASFHNGAWELESSINLNQQTITSTILAGGQGNQYNTSVPASDATQDYLPVGISAFSDAGACGNDEPADAGDAADAGEGSAPDASGDAAGPPSGPCETAEQVRNDDIAALFAGMSSPTVRVTRIRSDIAQSAMTVDLVLQAASDQSEVSNSRNVTQSVNETCPLYDGCQVTGSGTPAQAQASVNGGCGASGSRGSGAGVWFGGLGLLGLLLLRSRRARRRA
jgi:hypothetical protein